MPSRDVLNIGKPPCMKLSRPHVRIFEIDPPTEEELDAQEARIAAEGDNGTFVPDLTLEDVNMLEQTDSEELTLDQLMKLAEREDVLGVVAARNFCETISTAIGLVRQTEPGNPPQPPKTFREKVARVARETLEKILPELFADCGRKPQLVKGRHCWITIASASPMRGDERYIPPELGGISVGQLKELAKGEDVTMATKAAAALSEAIYTVKD
jgi:hypothetical protein